jgi:hypothetical protein
MRGSDILEPVYQATCHYNPEDYDLSAECDFYIIAINLNSNKQYVILWCLYRVILSVLDPRKWEYLRDCSLDFEHAYMTTIYEHFQHLL